MYMYMKIYRACTFTACAGTHLVVRTRSFTVPSSLTHSNKGAVADTRVPARCYFYSRLYISPVCIRECRIHRSTLAHMY